MPTYSEEILRLAEITPVEIPEGMPSAELANRLCGDKVRIALTLGDDTLQRVHWQAEGCAILRASAAFMARVLENNTIAQTYHLIDDFSKSFSEENAFRHGGLEAVYKLPARYKCALLPWQACQNLLNELKR